MSTSALKVPRSPDAVKNAGRISQDAVIGSTAFLLVLVVLCFGYRLYIRLAVHKVFQADDGFIASGVIFLVVALGALYHCIDELFAAESFFHSAVTGQDDAEIAADAAAEILFLRKWAALSLALTWTTITAIKFSFLFLFKQLIYRIRPLTRYWRLICTYTIVVYLYGLLTYFVLFRGFYDEAQIATILGGQLYHLTIATAISQLVLDIFGDLLILAIPIRLIWQIQVRWSQKAALICSLCLSIILIAVTITRASGLDMGGTVDIVWEVYWQFVSAQVGLILSSATAFRSLFVAPSNSQESGEQFRGWVKALLQRIPAALKSISRAGTSKQVDDTTSASDRCPSHEGVVMPQVPRPLMTGLRSFISRHQGDDFDDNIECLSPPLRSEIYVSHTIEVTYSDGWSIHELSTTISRQSPAEEPV